MDGRGCSGLAKLRRKCAPGTRRCPCSVARPLLEGTKKSAVAEEGTMDQVTHGTTPVLDGNRLARHSLPDVSAEAGRLAASVERAIQRETGRGVKDLSVEAGRNGIVLRGRCATYFTKQKAQHAAMEICGGRQVSNRIEVG